MSIYFNFILFLITSINTLETGTLDDKSFELMINEFKSVEQVYFPNLNQVINNLDLIIQNQNLSKLCKKSLNSLKRGIKLKHHWALSCK